MIFAIHNLDELIKFIKIRHLNIILIIILHMLSKQLSGLQMTEHISSQGIITNNTANIVPVAAGESLFDLILIIKIIFYLIFVVKIITLSFLRRKRYSLKQRIYRKFLFAHQELLRYFTDEDKSIMEITLSNTAKNATVQLDPNKSKIRRPFKRVSFQILKNSYYDPQDWKEQSMRIWYKQKKMQAQSNQESKFTFEEKKMEQQFVERLDLLGLNQKQDELLPLQSKLTQQAQIIYQNLGSDNINGEKRFQNEF